MADVLVEFVTDGPDFFQDTTGVDIDRIGLKLEVLRDLGGGSVLKQTLLEARPSPGGLMGTNHFRKTIGDLIRPTKQDIFFFGPPARHANYFTDAHMPVWGDHGKRFFYGIPGSDRRGFKMADDTRGAAFDPTRGERVVSMATLKRVREYLELRFPAMKDAPLIEMRVCQYEQTPDSNFILDRHPKMENVWILGGGSGHGFKHGPALGEMAAELVLNEGETDASWRLSRFKRS